MIRPWQMMRIFSLNDGMSRATRAIHLISLTKMILARSTPISKVCLSFVETDPIRSVSNRTKPLAYQCMITVVFLERLSDIGGTSLPTSHISTLDSLYSLSTTPNVEIRQRFYNLVLSSSSAKTYLKGAAEWVVDPKLIKGRMKFCRPTFRSMADVDKEFARATFRSNSQFFHPIARRLIEKVCTQAVSILFPDSSAAIQTRPIIC